MGAALSKISAAETKWTIISGPMTGTVRLMESASFVIGRSPECQFVIVNDPKVSRKHAQVQWSEHGCEILSLNQQNLIAVNGRELQICPLADGDVLTIGETQVQFNLTTLPATTNARPRRETHVTVVPQSAPPMYAQPSPPRSRSRSKKNNPGKIAIYFVIGIVILFFLTPSGKKKDEQQLRTEQQIQADIDAANKMREAAQNSALHHADQSITAVQAQENFVRGFRDYRKGQFERSLDSFQACLALDPTHALCNRYIRLAQRRFKELVQYNIVLGRKYRDQNQFQACRAAFRNVMVMVKDSNSLAYKESKANYDACNSLVEGRF